MKQSLGAKPLAFPTPVYLVGSYDTQGQPNMMNAAWGGICCSDPPCVMVSVQKKRHTYAGILENQAFTINLLGCDHVIAADFYGIASGRDLNKIDACGQHVSKGEFVDAPCLDEAYLVIECRLKTSTELGTHTMFVGEVMDVKIEADCLDEKGVPDVKKMDPLLFIPGAREYYGVGEFIGKAFAVGNSPKEGK
ncbi:flavin reductase family protein [Yoonia sp.]|uniref:flavin reductase family protein n=1 Tax=Yoonia sp. TaxID=2212373 RepID=UPI003975F142